MKAPALPADEHRRLATLHSLTLLDTPPEPRFDAITAAAAALFGMPTALISLVDEHRQWFKSRHGLTIPETPRDVSFCGHAILGRDVMVVDDTLLDERFRDNPLVLEAPNVRFYAGTPISAPDGARLGTLCLLDRKPRALSDPQREALRHLGAWVEAEVRITAERHALGGFLDRLLEQVGEPVVLAGEGRHIRFANTSALKLLCFRAPEIYGKPIVEIVSPEQRPRFEAELRALGRSGEEVSSLEYRTTVRCGNGAELLVTLAFFRCDIAGRPVTAVILRP